MDLTPYDIEAGRSDELANDGPDAEPVEKAEKKSEAKSQTLSGLRSRTNWRKSATRAFNSGCFLMYVA